MKLENVETVGNIAVSFSTTLALICGGIFGLVEYLDYKKDNSIKYSLSLVSRYQAEDVLKQRIKTDSAWQDANDDLVKLLKIDRSVSAYEGFLLSVVKKNELDAAIITLMGFYDETVVCVKSRICDKATINSYFLKSGRTFFNKYYPYVCLQRNIWSDPTIWFDVQRYFNPKSLGKICH